MGGIPKMRDAGTQSAQQTDQRRDQIHIGKGGFDDEQAADKRAHHRYDLVELQFFAQQPKGKQNGEEG